MLMHLLHTKVFTNKIVTFKSFRLVFILKSTTKLCTMTVSYHSDGNNYSETRRTDLRLFICLVNYLTVLRNESTDNSNT